MTATEETCSGPECDRPCYGRTGVCNTHYQQKRNRPGQPLTPVRRHRDCLLRDTQGRKQCTRCGEWKDTQEFYANTQTADSLTPDCKECKRVMQTERIFGLSPGSYARMLSDQGGSCKICGRVDPTGRKLHVDHDHSCCSGKTSCGQCVRGLLCGQCNTGLGMFRDDPDCLEAAASYLRG